MVYNTHSTFKVLSVNHITDKTSLIHSTSSDTLPLNRTDSKFKATNNLIHH